MPATPPPPTLLQRIYTLGETLCRHLEAEDVEAFLEGVKARAALLEHLRAYTPPAHLDPEWAALADQFADQHERLTAALTRQEAIMREALQNLHRFKGAQQSYHPPAQPSGGVLHGNLSG